MALPKINFLFTNIIFSSMVVTSLTLGSKIGEIFLQIIAFDKNYGCPVFGRKNRKEINLNVMWGLWNHYYDYDSPK